MDSYSPVNLSSGRKKAIDELRQGHNLANQLKVVLHKSLEGSVSAEDLVTRIMDSFSNTLSILNSVVSEEVSQVPASTHSGWDGRKSEDSGESIKSSALKDRRGCYKRRKNSHSWTKESPTLIDDGHAWRKYGQKLILNAKHPRNYFRCTHKYDQGCQATKQVQRLDGDATVYKTTYLGHHTCQNLLKASQSILDPTGADSSVLISFNNSLTNKQDGPFFTSFPSIKQEYPSKNEIPNDHHLTHNHHHSSYSSSDFLLSHDHHLSSFDHGDVISGVTSSCTNSSPSLDTGLMGGFGDDWELLNFVE